MSKRRIDYIGLIWRNDAEYFQTQVVPLIQKIERICISNEANPGKIKYRVGAARSGQGSTYEVDAWGMCADYLAQMMPLAWWLRLTRLDYRREIGDFTQEEIHTFAAEIHRRGVPGFNTAPINKRDAAKTNRRGIGGAGLQVGSWKSNRSLTIYKRRREPAAIELRLNLKLAKQLGEDVHHLAHSTGDPNWALEAYTWAHFNMEDFLQTAFGQTDVDALIGEVVEYVRDIEDQRSEMAHQRDTRLRGQMDFWTALSDLGPTETGAFEVL